MPQIAIIIPYFGQWPEYTPLWLHSCAENSGVDFHIYTTAGALPTAQLPSNVVLHTTSFGQYCAQASQRLGITFSPTNPYKLCDLRPFYAIVHADVVHDYQFWGWGDVDLVWGNLRAFYTDALLQRYDVLSTHADRLSGHLCLLRNNPYNNNLCYNIPDWQAKLQDTNHHALDEVDLSLTLVPRAKWLWKLHSKVFFKLPLRNEWQSYVRLCTAVQPLIGVPKRVLLAERYTTPFTRRKGVLYHYNGHSVYSLLHRCEVPYVHFYSIKRGWPTPCIGGSTEKFTNVDISTTGIHCNP